MNSSGVIFERVGNNTRTNVGDLSSLITLRERAGAIKQAQRTRVAPQRTSHISLLGVGLVALALGGMTGPLTPRIRLETKYAYLQAERAWPGFRTSLQMRFSEATSHIADALQTKQAEPKRVAVSAPPAVPAVFDPLKTPDGASIDPVNKEFSLVIPKIGVNAAVIPAVNPTKPGEYLAALQKGIAHSSLSYFPNEDGTVFLFSHSTNYDWFVGDLNAVFYLLKNLEEKDTVVLFYKGTSYTYRITGKQIVNPTAVSYMAPLAGDRKLILQTCWPPGSTTERLLIFADLVEESNQKI